MPELPSAAVAGIGIHDQIPRQQAKEVDPVSAIIGNIKRKRGKCRVLGDVDQKNRKGGKNTQEGDEILFVR